MDELQDSTGDREYKERMEYIIVPIDSSVAEMATVSADDEVEVEAEEESDVAAVLAASWWPYQYHDTNMAR